jgi:hypothetical protein
MLILEKFAITEKFCLVIWIGSEKLNDFRQQLMERRVFVLKTKEETFLKTKNDVTTEQTSESSAKSQ